VTPRSAVRALTTACHAGRAVGIDKIQDSTQTGSAGTQIKVASRPGEPRTNLDPRVDDEVKQSRAILRGADVQKALEEQRHQPTIATSATSNAVNSQDHGSIDIDQTATPSAKISSRNLTPGAMNTDHDSHPTQEPVQLRGIDRGYGAREDAAASASNTAGDAELVEDTIVVQHSTPIQTAVMNVTSNIQREVSSEPPNFQAAPGSEVDAAADQPHLMLRGSQPLETETRQTTVSTQSTGDAINEPGLQNVVNKLEITTPPAGKNSNTLKSMFFRLYLDEDTDPLEPQSCVKLTGLTTRDELFKMMDEDFEDDLGTGEKIVAVRVKRADGKIFLGPNVLTMPIKRVGQQDMWRELISTLLEHGAGEEGLRGYVKVKKRVDAK
jgi:hypothetical protein